MNSDDDVRQKTGSTHGMLEAAFDAVGKSAPWEFYELRDFRTLKNLPPAPDLEFDGTEHDALDDAKHQARVAATTFKRLQEAERDGE